ncbi:calcium-transporting ATPase 8, plasma membrane-type isoform X7 [Arachis ipaensis]|uniref:calcium-transporting ATPase 8, plasma membrane-type isoform X7 n=1 Tax=Arachis ipaensis TaxID=130454 RepID=UPI000A2B44C2|nr:calcium-transporting ATPase 8, plasma membrane-type isoform X7 [Arachis ipaensis]
MPLFYEVLSGVILKKEDEQERRNKSATVTNPINNKRQHKLLCLFYPQAALVLNASRRFRYTLDLKKQEEKTQILRKIRAHAQAIRAAYLFKAAGDGQVIETTKPPAASAGEFPIGQEQLASVSREHDTVALQQYGGVAGISNLLKTNLEKGIHGDDADLLKRRNAFGSNDYPRKKGRSFWMFMWDACKDLTLIILMVAAAASLALGIKSEGIEEGWYDGGSIAFAVILVIVVTAISDYKQSLQFRNLNEEKRNIHLEVIRGGRRIEISIYEIVVGDVIPLNIGNQVPADGILITGHSLAIDESSMTGESKIVHKDSKDPFLMSGCKVADGSGTMLVTGVGVNTEWGLLMASISEDTGEETPLQVRLNGVATFIGIVGLSVAVVVLIVLLARFFSGHTRDASGNVQFKAGKTKVGDAIDGAIKIVTVAVTIVVVAVPEGLPLAVTLTLAYSMRKMMADKALVRRLSACETMGSATTICSDKTGTLTMNQMTVVEAYAGGKKNDPPGNKSELSPKLHSLLIEGVAQNTNGSVYVPEGGNDVEVSGSPTEKAILHWGLEIGMNFDSTRSESSIIHVFPFNSEKKRGGVAVQTADSEVHIHWKGAAEIVLACCTRYIDANDQLVDMDEEKDPCRPGVKDSVELCQKSGVKVVRWGRSVYANIQKFIQFQLTVNVAALVINVVAAVSSGDVPLNAVQLLWVNLIMDTLGALALATEPPTDHLMDRPPVGRREPLITNIMWRNLLIQAMYQVSVLLVLNFRGRSILGLTHDKNDHAIKVKNTLIFNAFVLSQIFNEFNARKPDEFNIFSGVTKNYLFMGIVGLTVVLQIIIIEFLGKFTSTVRLNWKQWLISVIIGFISWPLAVVGKLIPVPDTPINNVFSRFRGRRKEPEASQ